jgi:uncharacterized membrane protein YfcA
VQSSILLFFDTPALLIMISIWNFPVLGWEKWFLAVLMMCAGPVGAPTSAWITRQVIPYSSVSEDERVDAEEAEESEV